VTRERGDADCQHRNEYSESARGAQPDPNQHAQEDLHNRGSHDFYFRAGLDFVEELDAAELGRLYGFSFRRECMQFIMRAAGLQGPKWLGSGEGLKNVEGKSRFDECRLPPHGLLAVLQKSQVPQYCICPPINKANSNHTAISIGLKKEGVRNSIILFQSLIRSRSSYFLYKSSYKTIQVENAR
jgi:hypothetical protein